MRNRQEEGEPVKIEVIARAVVFHGERVLLCRNVKSGYHYLPGGHVEFGEPAAEALRREFTEETGVHVDVGTLLLTHEQVFNDGRKDHHEINLVFSAEMQSGGDHVPSLEHEIAFDWAAMDKLDALDLRPRLLREWLRRNGRGGTWISG